jgi:hypothetical protein
MDGASSDAFDDGATNGADATTDGSVEPLDPPLPLDAKAACGRPSVFVDDFADGVLSSHFNATAPPGGSIREENGRLVLAWSAGAVGSSDRWWRLREAAGMIYWESSSNGTTWVEKRKAAVPFTVSAVKVAILGEATSSMPSSISIGTPRFNVGP